jgi:hypothetical protein
MGEFSQRSARRAGRLIAALGLLAQLFMGIAAPAPAAAQAAPLLSS